MFTFMLRWWPGWDPSYSPGVQGLLCIHIDCTSVCRKTAGEGRSDELPSQNFVPNGLLFLKSYTKACCTSGKGAEDVEPVRVHRASDRFAAFRFVPVLLF